MSTQNDKVDDEVRVVPVDEDDEIFNTPATPGRDEIAITNTSTPPGAPVKRKSEKLEPKGLAKSSYKGIYFIVFFEIK